jgi:hypothetical protein
MENIDKNQFLINYFDYSKIVKVLYILSFSLLAIIFYFIAFYKVKSYTSIYGDVDKKNITFIVKKEELDKIYEKKLFINKKEIKYKISKINLYENNYVVTINVSKKIKKKIILLVFKIEQETILKKELNNLKGG